MPAPSCQRSRRRLTGNLTLRGTHAEQDLGFRSIVAQLCCASALLGCGAEPAKVAAPAIVTTQVRAGSSAAPDAPIGVASAPTPMAAAGRAVPAAGSTASATTSALTGSVAGHASGASGAAGIAAAAGSGGAVATLSGDAGTPDATSDAAVADAGSAAGSAMCQNLSCFDIFDCGLYHFDEALVCNFSACEDFVCKQ
jgi:hypothetical protein